MEHPVLLIDLAVPRDIEPEVGNIPFMTVYDIDYFHVDVQNEQVKANIARAEQILREQQKEFFEWYEGRDLIPRIQQIKELAAKDLDARLTRVLKGLPLERDQEEELEQQIDGAAARMVNKLLFGLKDEISESAFRECMGALEKLYHISENQQRQMSAEYLEGRKTQE